MFFLVSIILLVHCSTPNKEWRGRDRLHQTNLGPSSEAAAEQSGDAATDRVTALLLWGERAAVPSCLDQVTHRRCSSRGTERGEREWVRWGFLVPARPVNSAVKRSKWCHEFAASICLKLHVGAGCQHITCLWNNIPTRTWNIKWELMLKVCMWQLWHRHCCHSIFTLLSVIMSDCVRNVWKRFEIMLLCSMSWILGVCKHVLNHKMWEYYLRKLTMHCETCKYEEGGRKNFSLHCTVVGY